MAAYATYLVCQLGSHDECKLAYYDILHYREVVCACQCHEADAPTLSAWRDAWPPRQYAKNNPPLGA